MSELIHLPNIGKVLEQHLIAVGIETAKQLQEIGAQQAFVRIRLYTDPTACIRVLYSLQGAILGIPDTQLSDETKTALKQFFRNLPDTLSRSSDKK